MKIVQNGAIPPPPPSGTVLFEENFNFSIVPNNTWTNAFDTDVFATGPSGSSPQGGQSAGMKCDIFCGGGSLDIRTIQAIDASGATNLSLKFYAWLDSGTDATLD